MIICKRYDVEGITNPHDAKIFGGNYLHFLEWRDKPGYYLIYDDKEYDGECLYEHLNNIGKCDYGDGCGRANVNSPISIGIFHHNFSWRFLDYIKENYVSEIFPCDISIGRRNGWYKIAKLEPEKWLEEFVAIRIKRQAERERESMINKQLDLF